MGYIKIALYVSLGIVWFIEQVLWSASFQLMCSSLTICRSTVDLNEET